jgi:hypothetical protein
MFDTIFALFKKDCAFKGVADASSLIVELVELFGEDYMKDKNAKNAAIDAVIKMLEEHKDKI